MFNITHIDKFFHNSPSTARCLGTPHFMDKKVFLCRKNNAAVTYIGLYSGILPAKSNTPPQATGHQICNVTNGGVFDPRGIRQIRAQAHVLDSLLAGINNLLSPAARYAESPHSAPASWHPNPIPSVHIPPVLP